MFTLSKLTFWGRSKGELRKAVSLIYEMYGKSIDDKVHEFYIHTDDNSICISFAEERQPKYTSFPSLICFETLVDVLWDFIEEDNHKPSYGNSIKMFNIVCGAGYEVNSYEDFHVTPVWQPITK